MDAHVKSGHSVRYQQNTSASASRRSIDTNTTYSSGGGLGLADGTGGHERGISRGGGHEGEDEDGS